MQKIEVWMIDYELLNLIVSYTHGRTWDFVEDWGATNDTDYLFQNLPSWPVSDEDMQSIDEFMKGENYRSMAPLLMHHMIWREKMPPGSYLVRVAWGDSTKPQQNFWLQHLERVKHT